LIDGLNLKPPPFRMPTGLIEARKQFEGDEMNFKQLLSGVGAIVALSATVAGPANAASVISYDSLTGSSFTGSGWDVGSISNFLGGESMSGGVQFVAAATGYIDSLNLSLYGATTGTIMIFTDNGSNKLGTPLETLSVNESPTVNSFATGSYTSGVTLEQGDKYWALAVAPTNGPVQVWNEYNYGTPNPLWTLSGQSIPCCTSVVTDGIYTGPVNGSDPLDGFGMILSIADAVPEPATWTLLIAGFGLMGAALRRKNRAFASA
jgi:hypothetical protein